MAIRKISLMLLIQLFFLNPFALAHTRYEHEVAICTIFQNEAPYLKEWIEFHKLVGVTKFYLYNNRSSDNFMEVLEPYINSGVVQLINWPHAPGKKFSWSVIQCNAYDHAIKLTKKKVRWLAVLDADEFLFPVQVMTLPEFLKDFERAGAVVVNWQMYGTSGVKKIAPNELLIEKLTYKAPTDYHENAHVKVIVNPKHVKKFKSPHRAIYKSGYLAFNSNNRVMTASIAPYILADKIRINHYWSRDEDYFHLFKVPRRQEWADGGSYERLLDINKEQDLSILKYVPKLKKALNLQ